MAMLALLLGGSVAQAASLDLIEVGGAYGTPGATNPTALWWNPAGLAGSSRFQFLVEAAPTFASVVANRANPDYGVLDPALAAKGYPIAYDYSGTDNLSFTGVVPFFGVSSNLMVENLGVGVGLAVPTARGGTSDQAWGANRFAVRAGSIQAIDLMAGAGYSVLGKLAFGLSIHLFDSSYYADTDTSSFPSTVEGAAEAGVPNVQELQDGLAEGQQFSTTAVFGGVKGNAGHGVLKDQAVALGTGIRLSPLGDKLGISVGYVHGVRLDHTGDLTLTFQCPEDYVLGGLLRGGIEQQGLCNQTVQGKSGVGYRLPSRIHGGVVVSPVDQLRLEAMGAYVMWSAFSDFDLHTEVSPDQFIAANTPEFAEADAALVTADRLWARDNQDTFWVGLDAKGRFNRFTGGLRVTYDHHAVPDQVVSANNLDNDDIIFGLLAEVDPIENLGIGLSFSHHFLLPRTVTDSAYGITADLENAKPDRYFYPSANGTYGGAIDRLGILVRGHWGGPGW